MKKTEEFKAKKRFVYRFIVVMYLIVLIGMPLSAWIFNKL
jgi:hypothetical protein